MVLREPIVLASASPRRQELLGFYGIPFEVVPSGAEEDATGSGQEQHQGKCQGQDLFHGFRLLFWMMYRTR